LSVDFTTLKALDPMLVSQLKETLPVSLFEQLNRSLSIDQDRLKFAEYRNRVLEEKLQLERIDKYGPGSEKGGRAAATNQRSNEAGIIERLLYPSR
jgi:hypothetical protein